MTQTDLTVRKLDQASWQKLAPSFHDDNYRQSWAFGEACARRVGAESEHIAIECDGRVIALADVRIRRLPLLGGGIAYINGGPLVRRDDSDEEAGRRLKDALLALRGEYCLGRGMTLRVRPTLGFEPWSAIVEEVFLQAGFVAPEEGTVSRTIQLDVSRPVEEIRAELAQKWRNCLNASERSGLTIRTGLDGELFEQFTGLYREMHARKGFEVDLDAEFYQGLQPQLAGQDRYEISLAYQDDRPVAGHVASLQGDTCVYLLGASSDAGRVTKASYLLQWHTIQRAVKSGCRWYDLGGIDPTGNPGVYRFKRGMGGHEIAGSGPYEYAQGQLRDRLARSAERTYVSLRSLKRKIRGATLRVGN